VPTELRAAVMLFKPSGKYYSEESWRIPAPPTPTSASLPQDMLHSPDFHRIDGGPVLVMDGPWGYPHLFPAEWVLPTWQEALAQHIAAELRAQVAQIVAPSDLVAAIEGRR
jgi:hypothetical protein